MVQYALMLSASTRRCVGKFIGKAVGQDGIENCSLSYLIAGLKHSITMNRRLFLNITPFFRVSSSQKTLVHTPNGVRHSIFSKLIAPIFFCTNNGQRGTVYRGH